MSVPSDLERVATAIERLEEGDLDVDLDVDRDDEVGRLAAAVEELSETLASADVDRGRRERECQSERDRADTEELLDAVGDLFYVVDEDGSLRRWNETLAAVTGYDDDELASMHALELFDEEDAARVRRAFERDRYRAEASMLTADGDRIPYEFAATEREDPEGNAVYVGIGRDVSERVERERELERTSELLAQAQRLASVSGWELDVRSDPPELTATSELYRQVGHDPTTDDVSLSALVEAYHPEDRPRVEAAIESSLEAGRQYDAVARIRRPDGDERWMRTIGEPVVEDEDVVALRGSMQDVTDRRRRERELEQTTHRLDTVLSNAPVVVFALDPDGVITLSQGRGLDAFGREPGELVGESVFDLYGWHEGIVADAERALDGERVSATRTVEGTVFETTYQPVVDDDGDVQRVIAVTNDITERVERERDLERTADLLEQAERLAGTGGWEYDLQSDPPTTTVTDGLRRLYELGPDEDVGPERARELPIPADRERVRETVDAALERGEPYDIEHRMETAEGTERWVRSIAEPVRGRDGEHGPNGESADDGEHGPNGESADEGGRGSNEESRGDDGDLVAIRGSLQDVTEHKERELALESLHDVARQLLGAESRDEVAELIVDAAAEILDAPGVACYCLDAADNRLEPAAFSPGFVDLCGGAPSVEVGAVDSAIWTAFATDSRTVVDDPAALDDADVFGPDVRHAVVVPLGDHGVFVVAADSRSVDGDARRLIETVGATAAAAFDRLDNEAALRDREAQLERRNRRLERQIEIDELIRSITQSLVGAGSRAEIERTVPRRLVEADGIAFAWVGATDAPADSVAVRSWAGDGQGYLDDVSLELEAAAEPAVRTATSGEVTVVSSVVDGLTDEPWRRTALARNFTSVVSVPLTVDEHTVGVLTAYATEPDWVGDLERTVFAELGVAIADAITEAEAREALHAETVVELTVAIEDQDDLFARVARAADCTVDFEGLGPHDADEVRLFFATSGTDSSAVTAALEDLVSIRDHRLVSESGGECLFQATVTSPTLPARLVRHGASPRSIHATGDETEVVVDVPATTEVREFVDLLANRHADVDLRSRHQVRRSADTGRQLVASLLETLTDRQLEVLRTAYYAGFFDWPRQSTGEEVAELLEVTQPTVNRHLRLALRGLLDRLFDAEAFVVHR